MLTTTTTTIVSSQSTQTWLATAASKVNHQRRKLLDKFKKKTWRADGEQAQEELIEFSIVDY